MSIAAWSPASEAEFPRARASEAAVDAVQPPSIGCEAGPAWWSTVGLVEDRLRRDGPDGYVAWERHVASAGGCTRPVRLHGHAITVEPATGEVLDVYDAAAAPDGVVYKACGTRRASQCQACAKTYQDDAYQLLRAGITGSDTAGVPDSIVGHPLIFLTLTAPSFGPVHSTRTRHGKPRPCRARRDHPLCAHGRPTWCTKRHTSREACLGRPLCADCYDYDRHVIWNHYAPELWRRTTITLRRAVDKHAQAHGLKLRVSFGKVAEYQARGVVHFHALIRLDALDDAESGVERLVRPPTCLTAALLAQLAQTAARATVYLTPPHPDSPGRAGWLLTWGTQVDARPVRDGQASGRLEDGRQVADLDVASYLAKYATKATEAVGLLAHRLTPATVGRYAGNSHAGRLIAASWRLGRPDALSPPDQDGRRDYDRLRAWAHMLGFGGHFLTKSRRYSTTFTERRNRRIAWRRRHHLTRLREHLDLDTRDLADRDDEHTTLVIGTWTYAGNGWLTTGDQLLATTAAARAREHRAIAREEARSA